MSAPNLLIGLSNLFCALLVAALAVPLLRRKVKMNLLYGVRFAKSFESEESWYRINEHGAERMIFWSAVLAVLGVVSFFMPFKEHEWLAAAFGLAPLVYLVACLESYRYAQRL